MSPTSPLASLRHKLLAPFLGAMLLFAIGLHFVWLPARLADAREDFRRTQSDMLAVMKPALIGLLLSEDLVQVHAMLKQVGRDIPQWVDVRLEDPHARRLYPIEAPTEPGTLEIIWLETSLSYQNAPLGRLSVATDPTAVLSAETRKIWRLEQGLLAIVLLTIGLFVWFQNLLIVRPVRQLAEAANRLENDDFNAVLPAPFNDEIGNLIRAFDAMREKRKATESELLNALEIGKSAQQHAEQSRNLLHEAVSGIALGFTIYDAHDRLVLCNEAYLNMYDTSRGLIVPGATFEEIVRKGAAQGQYPAAAGREDAWVGERVRQHQAARGEVIEQQLDDGRWLMIVEYRTPSGYIVGNRVDITELKRKSDELRQRMIYQRATLDNLPFQFWLKDADGKFLAVNKVFSESYGFLDPELMTGLTDFDICPRERAEHYRSDDVHVMTTRNSSLMEEPWAGDHGERCAEVFKKPVIGDDGELLGTVGFARDVTERKQMLRALAESEQRWSLAVTGANDGIWDWDVQTQTMYYSERWKAMLGFTLDELGSTFDAWYMRIHPEDHERVMAELQRHLGGLSSHYHSEYRLRRKDNSYLWVYDRGQALFDSQGTPIRMAGSLTDISDRRANESRILDRTEQLNAIFAMSPDGFVSFDQERKVKYASPAFLHMTGFVEHELVGLDETAFSNHLASLCREQARFPQIATLRSTQRSAESDEAGYVVELKDATQRMLEVRLRVSSAETVSQILYFRDVTHEVEVDRMKSEFLSTAAHELRTPMSSIFGFAELLLSFDFPEQERHEYLAIIHKQTGLMVSILNELLDLARIEARRGKDFNLTDIDIYTLLGEVIGGYKTPNGRPVPAISHSDGPLWVRADQGKLTQAIGNVLSNAYKYSPGGGEVAVDVIDGSADATHAQIGIRITDHGIGMTPEQLARAFERFYRADSSGKIPGTGLGMSIVKEIIELHGGHIDISSVFGQGTTVTLWVPVPTLQPLT